MKKGSTLKFIIVGLSMLSILMPYFAFADHYAINSNVFDPTILKGPLILCTGSNVGNTTQFAVCQNLCDLVANIAQVIYYMIAVILWIITPVLVVVGGLMIMLAGASSEMVGRGKKTITGVVWAVVIVLCSWVIIQTFVKVIGISGIGGFGTSSCSIIGGTSVNTANVQAGTCGGNIFGACPSGQTCTVTNGTQGQINLNPTYSCQ